MKIHSDQLTTTIFIQSTSNLDTTCKFQLSRGTFLDFLKFPMLTPFLVKNWLFKDLFDEENDIKIERELFSSVLHKILTQPVSLNTITLHCEKF